jgi:hypothetical protein
MRSTQPRENDRGATWNETLTLTSLTSGGLSVSRVRSRTEVPLCSEGKVQVLLNRKLNALA